MADLETYTSKITSAHSNKPKFMKVVAIAVQPFVDNQNVLDQMVYDIDNSEGLMLDYIGEWVGFKRYVDIPLDIYFSFDTEDLGFDEGIWFAPFDPVSGTTRLDDDSYRRLLKAKVGINNWDSTAVDFNAIMDKVFDGSGVSAYAVDNQDKTFTVKVSGSVPLILKTLLDNGLMIPKPAGFTYDIVYL